MVTLLNPAGVSVMGNINVVIVPAATLAGPTVAQITAAGGLDITQILYASGWKPTRQSNVVTAPRRLGDTRKFNRFGLLNEEFPNLQYMIDPQAASGANGKKAYELLVPLASLFAVERMGPVETTAFAIGQFVRVAPIQPGPYNFPFDATDEAAEFMVDQQLNILSPGWGDLVAIPS